MEIVNMPIVESIIQEVKFYHECLERAQTISEGEKKEFHKQTDERSLASIKLGDKLGSHLMYMIAKKLPSTGDVRLEVKIIEEKWEG